MGLALKLAGVALVAVAAVAVHNTNDADAEWAKRRDASYLCTVRSVDQDAMASFEIIDGVPTYFEGSYGPRLNWVSPGHATCPVPVLEAEGFYQDPTMVIPNTWGYFTLAQNELYLGAAPGPGPGLVLPSTPSPSGEPSEAPAAAPIQSEDGGGGIGIPFIDLGPWVVLLFLLLGVLIAIGVAIKRQARHEDRQFQGSTRQAVWKAGDGKCIFRYAMKGDLFYCTEDDPTHGDHWKPYSKGGTTTKWNGVVACAGHNMAKSANMPWRWVASKGKPWAIPLVGYRRMRYLIHMLFNNDGGQGIAMAAVQSIGKNPAEQRAEEREEKRVAMAEAALRKTEATIEVDKGDEGSEDPESKAWWEEMDDE